MMVKICGLKEVNNITAISQLNPDLMGFIFYPSSKRYVGKYFIPEMLKDIPSHIGKVGVFVNENLAKVIEIHQLFSLDYVQVHGDESVAYCEKLHASGINIIKAFGVHDNFDFKHLEAYKPFCKYFLFDTYSKDYGGSGIIFNWELLSNQQINHPYLLSGGIGLDELQLIADLKLEHCIGIDANSKLELSPGLKELNITKTLINKIKDGQI